MLEPQKNAEESEKKPDNNESYVYIAIGTISIVFVFFVGACAAYNRRLRLHISQKNLVLMDVIPNQLQPDNK
jgi:hypothetical protein